MRRRWKDYDAVERATIGWSFVAAGLLVLSILLGISVLPRLAQCQVGCIQTPCGSSAECPGGCFCALGPADPMGVCVGSR